MTNCPTGIFWATNCPRWQNVPLSPHATNCPSDKMSHFLPGDKMSHWWSYWKTIVSLAFFRRQIVPRWQNVPLSPRRQNVPTYALMHMKVMESCWDILSPVKKAIGTICRKWKRPLLGIVQTLPKVLTFKLTKWDNRQNVPTTFHNFPVHKCISWDILSSGTICRSKNTGGTICRQNVS